MQRLENHLRLPGAGVMFAVRWVERWELDGIEYECESKEWDDQVTHRMARRNLNVTCSDYLYNVKLDSWCEDDEDDCHCYIWNEDPGRRERNAKHALTVFGLDRFDDKPGAYPGDERA